MSCDPWGRHACWRRLPLVLVSFLLVACDEEGTAPEPGPCDRPGACVVEGPDLVVAEPRVLWPESAPTDPITDYPVMQPGVTPPIEISIRNRGDESTDATTLQVFSRLGGELLVDIPALEPGAEFVDTITLDVPAVRTHVTDLAWIHATLNSGDIDDDPIYGNDFGESDTFHVAVPMLVASIELATDEVRIAEPLAFTVTLENLSRHAASPPVRVAFCWYDFDVGCGSWIGEPFGLLDVPAIPASGSWSLDTSVVVPAEASYLWQRQAWSMFACVNRADATLEDFGFDNWIETTCLDEPVELEALPNLEATCPVVVVEADTTLTHDDAPDCVESSFWDTHADIYAVDLAAGDTLDVTGPLLAGIDADGLPIAGFVGVVGDETVWRIVASAPGRAYLVVTAANYTLNLRRNS